jgi:hypothetical protein
LATCIALEKSEGVAELVFRQSTYLHLLRLLLVLLVLLLFVGSVHLLHCNCSYDTKSVKDQQDLEHYRGNNVAKARFVDDPPAALKSLLYDTDVLAEANRR